MLVLLVVLVLRVVLVLLVVVVLLVVLVLLVSLHHNNSIGSIGIKKVALAFPIIVELREI